MRRWFSRTNCHKATGMLSAFLDGYLSAGETAWLEAHLAGCAHCQEELASLKATVSLLQQIPEEEPGRSFRVTPRPAPVPVPVWGPRPLRLATAVVTILLVAVITVDMVGLAPGALAPQPVADGGDLMGLQAPAGPQGPAGAQGNAREVAPQEKAQPTPQPLPATAGDMRADGAGVTTTPGPQPVPAEGMMETAPASEQASSPLATPELQPREPLLWPVKALEIGLAVVWVALVVLMTRRWAARRGGTRARL